MLQEGKMKVFVAFAVLFLGLSALNPLRAETISGAGPSHALWYSLSEDQNTRRKNSVGLIQPAIELVSTRLGALGHSVREVFITKPSSRGATIHYSPKEPA